MFCRASFAVEARLFAGDRFLPMTGGPAPRGILSAVK